MLGGSSEYHTKSTKQTVMAFVNINYIHINLDLAYLLDPYMNIVIFIDD